jgi:hypothetical protein
MAFYWPQGWEKDTKKFATPIEVSAFINILTSMYYNLSPNNKP